MTSCCVADVFTKATDEDTFHRMNNELRNNSRTTGGENPNLGKARRLYESLLRMAFRNP